MTVQLGRYKVVKELGRGGMGVVFLAEDTILERQVAVKVLPPAGRKEVQAQARQRFLREARVSARLDHPFVIHLHDIGQADGCDYLVMEFIRGGTLRERLEEGIPALPEVCRLFWEICQGVSYAHQMGVVHRDLKPDNMMVTQDGHIKIMDFGLAWQEGQARLTGDGAVMGTLAYFAPEQARGERVDARADIYSLGAILFEMLTGRLVFEAASPMHMIEQVLKHPAPSPRVYVKSTPEGLEQLVACCLRKDPAKRFATVADMVAALEMFMTGNSVSIGALSPQGVPAPPRSTPAPAVARPPDAAQEAARLGPVQLEWERVVQAVAHMQKGRIVDTGVLRNVPPPAPEPRPAQEVPKPAAQARPASPAAPVQAVSPAVKTPPASVPTPERLPIRAKRMLDGRYRWADVPPADQ